MPFGNLNTTYRLGIANTYVANKFRWAREVLRLSIDTFPQYFPVYQGGIVHAASHWTYLFSRDAEQCWASTGDSEHGLGNVMRQVVAFDTGFSRKNTHACNATDSVCAERSERSQQQSLWANVFRSE